MKVKKILALILSLAMIMSTMGIVASADDVIIVTNGDELQKAVLASSTGNIELANDIFITSKPYIARPLTLNGNGYTIKADNSNWSTDSYKHIIGINSSDVTVKNVVFDCNGQAQGINIYKASNVLLENVTLLNCKKFTWALVTVNGSQATVNNFTANDGSAFVGFDVSNGQGVTGTPSLIGKGVIDLGNLSVNTNSSNIDFSDAVKADGTPYLPMVEINGTQYKNLQDALDKASSGDIITLLEDLTVEETVIIDKDLTIDGTEAKYTIKGADGVDSNFATVTPIKVTGGADVTLQNVTVVGGGGDLLNSNTVAAYGAYAVVVENSTLNVENSTLRGGDVNTDFVAAGGAIDAINSTINVSESTLETGKDADNLENPLAFPVLIIDDNTDIEISDTVIRQNVTTTRSWQTELISKKTSDGQSITEKEEPVAMYGEIAIEGDIPLDGVEVVVPAGKQIKITGKVAESMFIPASEITVNLVAVDENDPENNEFYIKLTAGDNTKIFEFETAQLTFNNESTTESTGARMPYDVYGENGVEVIRNLGVNTGVNAQKQTFGFYLNDTATLTDGHNSGAEITIGKVVFNCKGAMKMNVVAEESEVVATKVGTTDEAHYTLDAAKDASYSLDAVKAVGSTSQHEKRNVKISVEFEHDMNNIGADADSIAYRNLKVTLKDATGVSVTKDIEMENVLEGEVTFDDVLVGVITVKLEAPGFRTYTYQTTMEEGSSANGDLVLNFWNSVLRDKEEAIEEDKATMKHNFLVGDIAMDYIIDKYDLAAVTSYYGNYDIKTGANYIKYDLNRDHQIDILDVAYVLHGMGN